MKKIFFSVIVVAVLAACQRQTVSFPPAGSAPTPLTTEPPASSPAPDVAGNGEGSINTGIGVKVPPELFPDRLPAPVPAPQPIRPQSSYQPFTLAAYQQAKAAGRPIFLYFYANWCPLCRPQEPIVVELFGSSEVRELGIAGFRVNYDDKETDDDERALARELGASYQHTFFTFDSSGRQVWRFTGTQSREQLRTRLEEISK